MQKTHLFVLKIEHQNKGYMRQLQVQCDSYQKIKPKVGVRLILGCDFYRGVNTVHFGVCALWGDHVTCGSVAATTKLLVSVGRALDRDFECKEQKCPDGSCIPKDQKCGEWGRRVGGREGGRGDVRQGGGAGFDFSTSDGKDHVY